jgi:thymidylate synthase ThyX
MFKAKILADSTSFGICDHSNRIITTQLTFPRCILAEFNTHKSIARNAASSRAIPVSKMIKDVEENPFVPIHWGKNQKGMQANEVLERSEAEFCKDLWLEARDNAVDTVNQMVEVGLHKQIANRLLEPWMWVTVIATGNMAGWNNFLALRAHKDAEPHMQKIAYSLKEEIIKSKTNILISGEWHLPLIGFQGDEDLSQDEKVKVSVGRVARVSYLTHNGVRDPQADIELHDRLIGSGHFSPTEHIAMASTDTDKGGNLGAGWTQYRKTLKNEFQSEGAI